MYIVYVESTYFYSFILNLSCFVGGGGGQNGQKVLINCIAVL